MSRQHRPLEVAATIFLIVVMLAATVCADEEPTAPAVADAIEGARLAARADELPEQWPPR